MEKEYDIIVVGGGHAGCEAAFAAARLGMKTALISISIETIAQMSCNPAIGGVGKGQIVREIDAMGGVMALAADATAMQFRMLNASKGPAVHGPRCQSDRHAYAKWMQNFLKNTENLDIIEGMCVSLETNDQAVTGVGAILTGENEPTHFSCKAAIITAGTFLRGILHRGEKTWEGGRINEPAANSLSESLIAAGVELDRLKTGTCPRLAAETVDYSKCTRQDGDEIPTPFSFMYDSVDVEQIPCWLSSTNEKIHQKIRDNLHRAPMYTGQISSTGPRYCPSFETKVERFADKDSHQIFIEPESRSTNWIYCNGITSSMPIDVQDFMMANIPGLENAKIIQYGYAIEYDYAPPTQMFATLQTKCCEGLYLAGQLNGTTGYEEAAALGMMAATNAALKIMGKEPLILRRDQAYIGVMIDDLITKGVTEPYRMFTSRAEHRLSLRADNADRRLTPIAKQVGMTSAGREEKFNAKLATCRQAAELMKSVKIDGKSVWELMKRPNANVDEFVKSAPQSPKGNALRQLSDSQPQALRTMAIDAAYSGYLAKQTKANAHLQDLDVKKIPADLDYHEIAQLRYEAREKLSQIRPANLGQALRVSGITPADISVLAIYIAGKKQS